LLELIGSFPIDCPLKEKGSTPIECYMTLADCALVMGSEALFTTLGGVIGLGGFYDSDICLL